jgi:hypothetical protein
MKKRKCIRLIDILKKYNDNNNITSSPPFSASWYLEWPLEFIIGMVAVGS